ncbi:alanine racemase [Candidatus Fermentibacterales bacterium]|nr:alanine racemase [Candidatus Fermentibacterales bacterium]
MQGPARIELSRKALKSNLRFLRKEIGPSPRISLVVKGNAYGHGIESFVPLAQECGADHFSVFSSEEAGRVTKASARPCDLMVMGYVDPEALDWMLATGISFYVFELDRLRAALCSARRTGRPARVHLQLETGMNRLGLDADQLRAAVELIGRNREHLSVEGVCTHFAGAESVSNYLRIRNQISVFEERCRWLDEAGVDYGMRHTACSAAALAYPETIMDMVRFGIVAYGFWPTRETRIRYLLEKERGGRPHKDPLRRVMTLKSSIMSIKNVVPGDFVGYGISYQAAGERRIASIPVGYSLGLARSLSNLGHVLVHGCRAPIAGLVNMSMALVDVTHLKDVNIGDEVVIIGRQGRSSISVSSFSDMTGRLNYEVLVRLPERIPRAVVE